MTMKCSSCGRGREFSQDGYPVEGTIIANQLTYLCNDCVKAILSNDFWTGKVW